MLVVVRDRRSDGWLRRELRVVTSSTADGLRTVVELRPMPSRIVSWRMSTRILPRACPAIAIVEAPFTTYVWRGPARTIVSGHGIRPARLSKRAKQHHRRPIGEPRIMSPLRRRASELPQADSGRARASAQDEMPRKCGPQGLINWDFEILAYGGWK